jgi:hypothetical protein
MNTLTPRDISRVPPIDTSGEIEKAAQLLKRFRKQLEEVGIEWRYWVAESLVAGLPPMPESDGVVA